MHESKTRRHRFKVSCLRSIQWQVQREVLLEVVLLRWMHLMSLSSWATIRLVLSASGTLLVFLVRTFGGKAQRQQSVSCDMQRLSMAVLPWQVSWAIASMKTVSVGLSHYQLLCQTILHSKAFLHQPFGMRLHWLLVCKLLSLSASSNSGPNGLHLSRRMA